MRKTFSFFILLVLSVAVLALDNAGASNEKAEGAEGEKNERDADEKAEAERRQKAVHPDFHKRTLQTVNGHTEISEDSVQSMVEGVRLGSGKEIPAAERVQKIEVLDVYRDVASVKVVTGRWIDYMHLSKLNGEWRVLDVVLQYTRK